MLAEVLDGIVMHVGTPGDTQVIILFRSHVDADVAPEAPPSYPGPGVILPDLNGRMGQFGAVALQLLVELEQVDRLQLLDDRIIGHGKNEKARTKSQTAGQHGQAHAGGQRRAPPEVDNAIGHGQREDPQRQHHAGTSEREEDAEQIHHQRDHQPATARSLLILAAKRLEKQSEVDGGDEGEEGAGVIGIAEGGEEVDLHRADPEEALGVRHEVEQTDGRQDHAIIDDHPQQPAPGLEGHAVPHSQQDGVDTDGPEQHLRRLAPIHAEGQPRPGGRRVFPCRGGGIADHLARTVEPLQQQEKDQHGPDIEDRIAQQAVPDAAHGVARRYSLGRRRQEEHQLDNPQRQPGDGPEVGRSGTAASPGGVHHQKGHVYRSTISQKQTDHGLGFRLRADFVPVSYAKRLIQAPPHTDCFQDFTTTQGMGFFTRTGVWRRNAEPA